MNPLSRTKSSALWLSQTYPLKWLALAIAHWMFSRGLGRRQPSEVHYWRVVAKKINGLPLERTEVRQT